MGRSRTRGLRYRLTLLVVAVLLPFVLVVGTLISSRYDTARKQAQTQAARNTEILKSKYDVWLARTEGYLESLSSVLSLTSVGNQPQCEAFQAAIVNEHNIFNVVVADASGEIRCVVQPIPSNAPTNVSDRPSFIAARDSRTLQILTAVEDPILRGKFIPIAFPWIRSGEFLGVIFAPVEIGELNVIMNSAKVEEGSVATVYDKAGTVLARNVAPNDYVGTDRSDNEAFIAASNPKGPSSFETDGPDGVRRLYSRSFVEHEGSEMPFVVVVGTPTSEVYEGANRLRTMILVGLGVLIIGALGASLVGAEFLILRPLRALQGMVRRTGQGDLGKLNFKDVKGVSELQDLGEAFGEMSVALDHRARQLEISESRFRTMINTLPAITFLVSPDGERFEEMSDQLETLIGLPPRRLLDDPGLVESILSPDDLNRWKANLKKCLDDDALVTMDLAFQGEGNLKGWLQINLAPSRDAEGNLLGIQGVAFDITDRVEAQRELAQMNVVLEDRVKARTAELSFLNAELARSNSDLSNANNELEAFSYSVSHDLRSPLRSVAGFARFLELDHAAQLDEAGLRFLARIQNAAARMGDLIDDLLSLAQVGKCDLDIGPINITEMAHEVAASFAGSDPSRSVKVTVQECLRASGDAALVQVLLDNLFGNAWKFTANEEFPRIEFGQRYEEKGGEQTFFISDNGAGFDMAYVDRLFKPFQRLHTTKEFEGTGIGLAIVGRIINRHGGKVWAYSDLGEGTTVFFTLSGPSPETGIESGNST